jgi:hypothetical protein
MTPPKGSNDSTAADAAINRVLAAEQTAQQEVAQCRRQALGILREARSRTRAVAKRADRRINRVHALSDAAIHRALADISIDSQMLSGTPELTPDLAQRLDSAIDRLIREILE